MVRSLSVENDALRKVNVSSFYFILEKRTKTPGRQHVWSVDMYVRWFRFVADFAGVFFVCVCVCKKQEMRALQRDCTALSQENGKLEVSYTLLLLRLR
jgi:hypothetical protein